MQKRVLLAVFSSLAFLIFLLFPSQALAGQLTLSGQVTDSASVAIAGATIDVLNAGTTTGVASTTTDSGGNYSLNIESGTYDVKVTPPSGSGFGSAIALSQTISANTILNFILVFADQVLLSGYIYDPLGNPVSNQSVRLTSSNNSIVTATTDPSGSYSLQVLPDTYDLQVFSINNSLSSNVPQWYQLRKLSFTLNQSTILNFTLPAKKVTVHVQDSSNNPVSNVTITTSHPNNGSWANTTGLTLNNNFTFDLAESRYASPQPTTDSSGDAILWLFPTGNGSNDPYIFTATPPSGSGFATTTLSNNTITNDVTKTITLLEPITLSGHIYDPLGNPVSNQSVRLTGANSSVTTATTDPSGSYSLQVLPGDFDLRVFKSGFNSLSLSVPQLYQLRKLSYPLNQNTVQDFTLPAKQVTVHVQDSSGNPMSNIAITTLHPNGGSWANTTGITLDNSFIFDLAESQYGTAGVSSPVTDSSGDAVLWLFPNGTGGNDPYIFTATPPSGSGLPVTTLSNIIITNNVTKTIVIETPISLSGHVYDSLDNPVSNQSVRLTGPNNSVTTATTDSSGSYSLQVLPDTYNLQVFSNGNSLALNVPQSYQLRKLSYQLTQNTTQDFTLPTKKVTVHVQDSSNTPVENVAITTSHPNGGSWANTTGITLSNNFSFDLAESKYTNPSPATDSSGDTILWLFPTGNGGNDPYIFTATPSSGSIYSQFTLSNILVTSDQTEIISLQFIHDRPVTTATLETGPDTNGDYSDPTTVTLSATAAQGFSIATTYYQKDGGTTQTYSGPFQVSGSGQHEITFWSIDNVGVYEAQKIQTFTIHTNQPPVLNLLSDATLNEGGTYSAAGSFNDPDSSSWTAIVDYDDWTIEDLTLSGISFTLNHNYKDNGVYTVHVFVTDNQGSVGDATANITVNNVNSTVSTITVSNNLIEVNNSINASATFTDPGVLDTHTASWNWGDGDTTSGTVTENNGSGSVSDSHTYTVAGAYKMTLTMTDDDNGSGTNTYQYIVVYDPSAGFITGSGRITSPAGAYTQNPSLTGNAIFGFVSKYQNGVNTPTGNTQFRFITANFTFNSTSYDWLVIAGARGQYKGSGTINGNGDYGFMLTAVDGQISGGGGENKFRLKVWDKGTNEVIYDNQLGAGDTTEPSTVIESGEIIIHS